MLVLAVGASEGDSRLGHVLGHYRLLSVIGEGGVGTVYEAAHVQLGRKMAIKVVHRDGATEEVVKRFFNEARAVNEIRHPNILEIEDFVTTDDGEHYLLMELLVGEDLRAVLGRDRLLAPERVTAIGEQLASALSAVHAVGIIHRDLKPDNVFLSRRPDGEERCKLLDFGIAKFITEGEGLTRAGMTLGTPEYMAPEQIVSRGQPGPRTDIYALGMLMYECLAGAPAFTATTTAGVLRGHISEPVVPPSARRGQTIPPVLEAVVMKCLAKDPDRRFASADEVRLALRADRPVERPVVVAPQPTPPPRAARGRTLQLIPAFMMAAAALVLHFAPRSDARPAAAAASPHPATATAKPAPVAPEPAPAPPPPAHPAEPVHPKALELELELVSQPAGAELFLGTERKPLGHAPLRTRVVMSSDPIDVVARFPDGVEVVQSVVPDRGLPPLRFVERGAPKVSPPTTKVSPPTTKVPPPATKVSPPKLEHDGTLDPFQ